ncbi:bifunctional 4-hydroxy-2-oxoglutarate aldolase/2-dehydro-3-deoxy-phosphogluconate aldolase [Chakrabartyella piscis]|uniref:bifunctional 4-hydroxy-2-oxoglutarate aldolase/2-dehydro-3-deoxy-phosphogluconate aldolase n=1 Tax=Chakrabartyella piscis TaxID=2918914 RepID=UPI00295855A2|nr:bifunctional 4-hydroxy-2-oxoglutarate aldolase/2-dehydro-3-deoxy-phosphogluconate aldolase [Chakrabartyella piscis]
MKLEELLQHKVVAIVRGVSSKYILDTVQALKDGGIHAVEITFDQKSREKYEDTLVSLKIIKSHFGDSIGLGVGTVMTAETVKEACDCGAEYIISPNVSESVIRETKKLGLLSIPGALTPTEAALAYEYGADVVKLFPAGNLGKGYIKALMGPLNHIPFMAVGGVNSENVKEFMDIGVVGVGIGGNLVNVSAIENGEFDKITAAAKEYMDAIAAM